jgi:hypothetical protein
VHPSLLAPRYQVQIPVRENVGEGRRWASLGEAIQNDLDHLVTDHPMARGLGALALSLAASLDTCEDRQIAPLARELKAAVRPDELAAASGLGLVIMVDEDPGVNEFGRVYRNERGQIVWWAIATPDDG